MTPSAAGAVNGRAYKYRAESADLSQWELGEGTWNASTGVLSRTTVLFNSSGTTSKINFAAAPQVAVVALKEDLISIDEANSFTDVQKGQALSNLSAPFQCGQLAYSSGTALTFKPFNGDLLKINGSVVRIPSGGITGLANTGVYVNGTAAQNLAASTLYYVYAFNNAGTTTADFSTTGHTTDATTGNIGTEIKSSDSTRTLIGLAYTNTSSQFDYSGTKRNVRSWFNRQSAVITGAQLGSNIGLNATVQELSVAARCEFVNWSGEMVSLLGSFSYFSSPTAGLTVTGEIGLDGAALGFASVTNTDGTNRVLPLGGPVYYGSPAEGRHVASMFGAISSGSGSMYAGSYYTGAVEA